MTVSALTRIPDINGDPAAFNDDATYLFGTQFPTLISQLNADIALLNFNSTTDTSATSNAIGTGAKTFTVSTGKTFVAGMYLNIVNTAAPTTNGMFCQITSYSGSTLVVNVIAVKGSGTFTAWTISISAFGGAANGANSDITSMAGLSGSPRLYLASDGTVTVGSATNDSGVPSNLFARRTTNTGFCVGAYAGAAVTSGGAMLSRVDVTSAELHRFYYTTTQLGSITTNGSVITYGGTSDYRLKENIQPLTNSGSFIDAIKPSKWTWKTNGVDGVGFIAHELQEVSPSSVHGDKDAIGEDGKPLYQSVGYSSSEIIANMVLELQSLRKRVAILENK